MPPVPKITKEKIIQGALALVRKRGAAALTAKSLAAKLGCSTQPVFWHFENMEALKKAVFGEALAVFGKFLRQERECPSPYMAIGLNYVLFAKEEKELFKLLFMSDFGKTDLVNASVEMDYILQVIEKSENVTGEIAKTIYRDMWVFSHGIAAMSATGTAEFSEEEVRAMLGDVCRGLIGHLKEKNLS